MKFVWLPQKRPGLAYIGVFHRRSIKLVPSIAFSQKMEGHFGSLSQRPWKEVNMMPSNTNNSPSDWYWDILRRLSSGSTRNMIFSKSQRLRQSWQSSSASQSLPSFSLASHCHRLGKSRRPRVPYIRHWKRMSRANSESSWSGKISLLRVPSWNTHLKESFLKSIFWAKHITTSTASLAGLLTKCGSQKSLNPLYSQNNMLCFWCWLLVICTADWVFNHKTLEKFSALCCMPVVQTLFFYGSITQIWMLHSIGSDRAFGLPRSRHWSSKHYGSPCPLHWRLQRAAACHVHNELPMNYSGAKFEGFGFKNWVINININFSAPQATSVLPNE